MKLSTGKVAFPIEFDNGDKDCIYFNPNDPDLATRMMQARDKITDRINNMQVEGMSKFEGADTISTVDNFLNLTEDEEKALSEKAEAIIEITENTKKIIFEELNTAFGSDISSVVFKHCSPFAVVDGEYFILQFLSAIAPEIQKHVNKTNESVEKNMAKHLNKYVK